MSALRTSRGVRWARITLVVGMLAAVVGLVGPPSASAQTLGGSMGVGEVPADRIGEGEGLDTLAACVNENGRLLVEVLFDASGSLKNTDPAKLRIPALKAVLGSLLSFSNGTSKRGPTEVDVEMSLFEDTYRGGDGFKELDSNSIDSFLATADGYANEDRGEWTDYLLALRGARDSLETRANELQAEGTIACKAIFWFTDGAYDISGATFGSKDYAVGVGGLEAQALGREELCREGGMADQLRESGIVNVTVALTTGDLSPSALGLLNGVVIGATDCGISDGASRFGVVLGVNDVNRLTETMLEAISGTRGQQQVPGAVCAADPCATNVQIRVPEGVGSFYLLTRSSPDVQRWITPPGGQPQLVEPGATTVGSSKLETTPLSPTTSMIDVRLDPSSPASGVWTISFIDPTGGAIGAPGDVDAYFFGALRPVIEPSSEIRQGEAAELVFQVVDAHNEPVDLSMAQRSRLTVMVTDPTTGAVARPTPVGPSADGRYTASYTASMQSTAAAMNVTASLSVVIDGGLALRPAIAESAIPVTVPVTVPSLVDTSLALPKVEGRGTSRGSIEVKGPERGAGQVCIIGWKPDHVPKSTKSVSDASNGTCETVQSGTSTDIEVALRPDNSGDGVVTGFVEVKLAAADDSTDSVTKSVPVKFRVIRSTNPGTQWLLAIGMTILGILIPLLLFYLLLVVLTRFRGLDRLLWAEIPVRIEGGVIMRIDTDGDEPGFGGSSNFRAKVEGEWQPVGAADGRQFTVGRAHAFTLRVLDRLASMSAATISVAGSEIVGRDVRTDRLRRRRSVVVPLDHLSTQWALAVDSVEFPAIEGAFDGTPQDTSADQPTRSVVTGAFLFLVDDFYGWRDRADGIFIDVTVGLDSRLQSLIAKAWKEHCETAASADSESDALVSAGSLQWGTSSDSNGQESESGGDSSSEPGGWTPGDGSGASPW